MEDTDLPIAFRTRSQVKLLLSDLNKSRREELENETLFEESESDAEWSGYVAEEEGYSFKELFPEKSKLAAARKRIYSLKEEDDEIGLSGSDPEMSGFIDDDSAQWYEKGYSLKELVTMKESGIKEEIQFAKPSKLKESKLDFVNLGRARIMVEVLNPPFFLKNYEEEDPVLMREFLQFAKMDRRDWEKSVFYKRLKNFTIQPCLSMGRESRQKENENLYERMQRNKLKMSTHDCIPKSGFGICDGCGIVKRLTVCYSDPDEKNSHIRMGSNCGEKFRCLLVIFRLLDSASVLPLDGQWIGNLQTCLNYWTNLAASAANQKTEYIE